MVVTCVGAKNMEQELLALKTKLQDLDNKFHDLSLQRSRSSEPDFSSSTFCVLKLDFPHFDGANLIRWIYQAKQYFSLHNTLHTNKVPLASFHLEGIALQWHPWITKFQGPLTWEEFTKSILRRFGPTNFEDPFEALSRLRQTTTIAVYQ